MHINKTSIFSSQNIVIVTTSGERIEERIGKKGGMGERDLILNPLFLSCRLT